MPSPGKLLQQERLKREVTLATLASQTCICSRYLQAIEEDDPKILPGDFFHRSFVKQYAQALHLDQQIIDAILAEMKPIPEVDPVPALTHAYQTAQSEGRSSGLYRPSTRVAVALLATVLIGCSGLFTIWYRTHNDEEVSAEPAAVSVKPPISAVAEPPTPQTAPTDAAPPAAVPSVHATGVEPGKIQVDLEAKEKTWVSLSSEGKTVFSGVLDPEEIKNFAVNENAKLMTGNAAGLDVRWNGKPIGPIGSRGQFRTVLLSAHTYQILPPRGL